MVATVAAAMWLSAAFFVSLLRAANAGYTKAVTPAADGSYPDCPCLNVTTDAVSVALLNKYKQMDGSLRTIFGAIVPMGHGNGECKAWESSPTPGDPVCDEVTPPDFCKDRWCFVDAGSCDRTVLSSRLFPGLSISYQTCGSIGAHARLKQTLANRTIRVFVPGLNRVQVNSPIEDRLLRSQAVFASYVLESAGATQETIIYKELSNASRTEFPKSSYSACVYDTVIGNIDLCVGDFWDTPSRRKMGGIFISTVFQEGFYLYGGVLKSEEENTFVHMLSAPLAPFTGDLWAMLISVSILAGISFCCFEKFELPEGEEPPAAKGVVAKLRDLSDRISQGVYIGLGGLTSGGASVEPASRSGRILLIGFSIFLTIVLASFTANTASFLVAKAVPLRPVTGFEDVVARGFQVCASEGSGINDLVDTLYPSWRKVATFQDEQKTCLEMVDRGEVPYAISSELVYGIARSAGELCNVEVVGQPILSFPTGWFGNDNCLQAVAQALTFELAKGTWEIIAKATFRLDDCRVEDESTVSDGAQLSPHELAGTCLILLLFFIVALIVRILELAGGCCCQRVRASYKASERPEFQPTDEVVVMGREQETAELEFKDGGKWVVDADSRVVVCA